MASYDGDGNLATLLRRSLRFSVCWHMLRFAQHVPAHVPGCASGEAASTHPSRKQMQWQSDTILQAQLTITKIEYLHKNEGNRI